jgi:hypothetical protein
MEILDLVEKSGLYWLKWYKAVDSARCSAAGNGSAGADNDEPVPRSSAAEVSSVEDEQDEVPEDEGRVELNRVESQESAPFDFIGCKNRDCVSCNRATQARGNAVPLALLHQRLGHYSEDMIIKMVDNSSIDVTLSDKKICVCDVCKANKITRGSVPQEREQETTVSKPFERVWTDIKGKTIKDFWGNEYIITFTCEVTRLTAVYFCQRKSQAKDRLKEFLQLVKKQGHAVRQVNSDGGGEYTSPENAQVLSEFQRICEENGITQRFTSPHTPAQNGISERLNRTLVERASAMLHAASLSKEF